MSSVNISSADIQSYANQLKQLEQEMTSVFDNIQMKMNSVQAIWHSPASTALMNEFQNMHAVFNSYSATIDNYAQYLTNTAETYQENEFMLEKSIQS